MRWLLGLAMLAVAQAALTGQRVCNDHDSTAKTDTYRPGAALTADTLQLVTATPKSQFGWIALGFGDIMANSPMVIAWPNSDGTFTLSQRAASSEVMPTVVAKPPRAATLSSNSSLTYANTTQTAITFSLPANTTLSSASLNATKLIWAFSSTNPNSKSASATLVQHDASGDTQIALLANLSASTASSSSASGGTVNTGKASAVLIAHVACGALATLLVLPLGAVVPRFARGMTQKRWWFAFHGINQGVVGLGLVVAAFALALTMGGPINSSHRQIGVALFVFTLLQTGLGIFTHYYIPDYRTARFSITTGSGRGLSNFAHMVLGGLVIILGFAASWKGIDQEWTLRGHGKVNTGYKAGWGIAVAVWSLLYLVGLVVFLPRQRRLERQRRSASRTASLHGGDSKPDLAALPSPPPPPSTRPTSVAPPVPPADTRPMYPPRRLPPPPDAYI